MAASGVGIPAQLIESPACPGNLTRPSGEKNYVVSISGRVDGWQAAFTNERRLIRPSCLPSFSLS